MIEQLNRIRREITEGRFVSSASKMFAGAGVIITDQRDFSGQTSDLVVKTPYARALSSLFFRLKEILTGCIDHVSKYEFYGSIGEAAIHATGCGADEKELLLAGLEAALRFMETGEVIRYFAYGSNMDTSQMACRCPGAVLLKTATLEGWRFALDSQGVATVVEDSRGLVNGLLWILTNEDKKNLDRYEGVGNGCYRSSFLDVKTDNGKTDAMVYVSLREPWDSFLSEHRTGYLDRIIGAAREFDFPQDYVRELEALRF